MCFGIKNFLMLHSFEEYYFGCMMTETLMVTCIPLHEYALLNIYFQMILTYELMWDHLIKQQMDCRLGLDCQFICMLDLDLDANSFNGFSAFMSLVNEVW